MSDTLELLERIHKTTGDLTQTFLLATEEVKRMGVAFRWSKRRYQSRSTKRGARRKL